MTYLVLALTTGRHWQVGEVSRIPWDEALDNNEELARSSREILGYLIGLRRHDFISPYYSGPLLLSIIDSDEVPLTSNNHPHRDLLELVGLPDLPSIDPAESITQMGVVVAKHREHIQADIQTCANDIETKLFDHFGLIEDKEDIYREISIRTNQNPLKEPDYHPSEIDEPPEDFDTIIKDTLLHLAMKAVRDSDYGIVPQNFDGESPDILDVIEYQFEEIFGQYCTERLTEIDQIIGDQRPEEESYPNIRDWLENDLFEYHVTRFDNTPVLWKITTENLVSDPTGVGFSCLVNFHELSPSTFDRLSNQYLEPQKSALREKRTSANQRRNDESLSTTERSKAADQFERCTSGLEQIAEFEEVIQELADANPRNWNDQDQQLASNLQSKVRDFRKETEKRLSLLDDLAELEGTEMQQLFTETFYSTVEEKRRDWIESLEDLETACDAYQKDASQPIEAHYYDLFKYFDDLIGSTHFASNGILFMIYYFEDGETYLEEGQPRDGLEKEAELLANLAVDLEDYVKLAEEINEDCQSLSKSIPSSWRERALSEIMTAGYHPKQKHGVEINITPLVESNAVPEIVEEKVLE